MLPESEQKKVVANVKKSYELILANFIEKEKHQTHQSLADRIKLVRQAITFIEAFEKSEIGYDTLMIECSAINETVARLRSAD